MDDAILGSPCDVHSDEFRAKLSNDVERVIFVDGGLAVKSRGGKWKVEIDGPMGEASSFVATENKSE